ncbi:BlaI/MecI/CopY family transcriptional regulator [Porifericola rhodea]|uniref:BlaI/MecI/CopY family transcriptional regulator n=1 Tax=Porifericola rhodea TaxID=930972 RepID=UPI0026665C53|nr:BlaI/MecI/CopY family transcriptional regulator [Porifericola rhodea]WKN30503.1 BlaI/MecI/CopY family transcriptional regulator [Porifericola rhodea]
MKAKDSNTPKPTEAELEILQVLWQDGPATVREVHDKLAEKRDIGYTTTLKNMQNMVQKGMLSRNEKSRSHIYEASLKQEVTQQMLLDRFMDSAFGGSAMNLVMQALGNRKTSKAELQKIKALINKLEGGEQ